MNLDELTRGDLVEVDWVDIFEDPTGDPSNAELIRRRSIGYFWAKSEDDGIPTMVTTTTIDDSVQGQSGYCVYPAACVTAVKVIKRKRRQKKSTEKGIDA